MNEETSRFWALTDLLDWTARDIRGRPVGRVADVIVDPTEGRIAYMCIRLSEPGTGIEYRVTVPWSAISRISESRQDIWIAARDTTLFRLGDAQAAGT